MAKILLLDNQRKALAGVVTSLRSSGQQVLERGCVASALETAKAESVDLLVSSEHLLGLDAHDLLEIRRADNSLQSLATIIVGESSARKLDYFKLGCDDFICLPLNEAEMFFRICALLRRIQSKGMRGNFTEVGILDVIQMLVAARRDGVLSVETERNAGALYFSEGHVIHAICGKETGEEAFLLLLRATQKHGTFIFLSESTTQIEHSIDKRTDHLLLGFANMLDEE